MMSLVDFELAEVRDDGNGGGFDMLRADVRVGLQGRVNRRPRDRIAGSRAKMFRLTAIACLFGSVNAGLALAHHSGVMFDRSAVRTIEGEVQEWRWSNPHSYLRIGVSADGGEVVEWNFEATSSALLARQGWRRTSFESGERVSVHYNPLRDDGIGGNLVGVTKADGTVHGREPQ